ncbi:hypothetical protein [Aestuariispira insulae]|uniref:hypothetical protein n=1 Tax=Aestuariispira insulae TaxID=1461337 RepID=UPI0011C0280B|nr:hypothetical protein [Aestuariispira insulae]
MINIPFILAFISWYFGSVAYFFSHLIFFMFVLFGVRDLIIVGRFGGWNDRFYSVLMIFFVLFTVIFFVFHNGMYDDYLSFVSFADGFYYCVSGEY